jgi:Protein of unknown function (DUF3800)
MPIYCDESGGLSRGVMTFAAVQIDAEAADAVLRHFHMATGLRGEMKGSRINLTERALLFELLARHDGRAWIATYVRPAGQKSGPQSAGQDDRTLYAHLLQNVLAKWLPESGGACADVVIDEGRYDPQILSQVEADVEKMLSGWGQADLVDSKRCAGVQIADVVANSFFNLAASREGDDRAARIGAIVAPFVADRRLRAFQVEMP